MRSLGGLIAKFLYFSLELSELEIQSYDYILSRTYSFDKSRPSITPGMGYIAQF